MQYPAIVAGQQQGELLNHRSVLSQNPEHYFHLQCKHTQFPAILINTKPILMNRKKIFALYLCSLISPWTGFKYRHVVGAAIFLLKYLY